MKRFLLFGFPLMAAGTLLYFLPTDILPVCPIHDGAAPMRCFYTARALTGYGALLFVLGFLLYVARTSGGRSGLASAGFAVCLSAALVPAYFIGTCRSPEMACNTGTYPGALVLLSLAAFICVGTLLYNRSLTVRERAL